MAGPLINTGETLVAGIRSDFWDIYQSEYDGVLAQMAEVALMDLPSDKRTEIYGARQSQPYPEPWVKGDPIPQEGTDSRQFSVTNLRYAKRVGWERDDRMDNLVGDLAGEARILSRNFMSLRSRLFMEVVTGTPSLLPAIPNAPDGAPIYSVNDDTGTPRFQVTGGNIVTGTGVATTATILADFYNGIERIGSFLNTKGEPFFEPDVNDQQYIIYHGIANSQIFSEAFKLQLVHSNVSSTGAAISNVVLANGINLQFRPTTRITGDDWNIFRTNSHVKAVFFQSREPIRESFATEENSDLSRDTGEEYVQFVERLGTGVNLPWATVEINQP